MSQSPPKFPTMLRKMWSGGEVQAWIDANWPAPAPVTLPPLNNDLLEILGRPNFACAILSEALRQGGHQIPPKSEHEQAAVIHFLLQAYLLQAYLVHGEHWALKANDELQTMHAAHVAAQAESKTA